MRKNHPSCNPAMTIPLYSYIFLYILCIPMNLEIPRVTGWFTVEAGVQMDVVTNWIPQIPLTCWLQSYWVISYLWLRCILGISRPLAGCSRLYGIGACSRLLRLNPSTWNVAGKCSRSCLRTIHSAARTVQGLGRLCASHAWLGQASIHIASTGSSGSYGHRHRSWPWQRAQSSSAQHPCTCRSRRSCVPMSSDRSHHQAIESSCLPWPPSSHGALDRSILAGWWHRHMLWHVGNKDRLVHRSCTALHVLPRLVVIIRETALAGISQSGMHSIPFRHQWRQRQVCSLWTPGTAWHAGHSWGSPRSSRAGHAWRLAAAIPRHGKSQATSAPHHWRSQEHRCATSCWSSWSAGDH